jgi:nucleoside-diphosphate-sugar epimerase
LSGAVAPGVALVGGSGLVGSALVQLLGREQVPVVVYDRRPPGPAAQSVPRWRSVDLLADNAAAVLAAGFAADHIDVVVHLAARIDPPRDAADRERMRRLHEHGTAATIEASRRAHVRRFVLVSSAVVYGASATNPVPLDEDAPVRPGTLPYAVDKARQEELVVEHWGRAGLTVVRPAIVYAPEAHSYLTEILRRARLPLPSAWPFRRGVLPALDGHRPPLQFVHVDDVAAVLAAIVRRVDDARVDGIFHACAADWLAYDDVARLADLVVVDVDAARVGRVLGALVPWMPPSWRAPPELFPYLMHPFVLSAARTKAVLGVTPRHSSASALTAMLARQPVR